MNTETCSTSTAVPRMSGTPNDVTRLTKRLIENKLRQGATQPEAVEYALHYLQNLIIQLATTNTQVRNALKNRIEVFDKIIARQEAKMPSPGKKKEDGH